MAKKVLFARISPEAHQYAMQVAKRSKEPGFSTAVFIERLIMSYKRKRSHDGKNRAAA